MERNTIFLDWKNLYCEMTVLPKAIYRFNAMPFKPPMVFFTKKKSQFLWKQERTQIAKAILIKKNGAGGINLTDFR